MLKLIVADFDGTLMQYGEKCVSDRVINKIKEYLDNGIHFAVASGRTYSELSALLKEISDMIYFIADDGALIMKNNEIIFKRPFGNGSIKRIFDDADLIGAAFYSLDTVYQYKDCNFSTLGKTPKKVEHTFQITDDIFKVTASVASRTFANCEYYRIHYNGEGYAELVQPYANKGMALSYLQLHLSISKFETVAIGDAGNDVPMMKYASESICIGNRSENLAKCCKHKFGDIVSAFEFVKK